LTTIEQLEKNIHLKEELIENLLQVKEGTRRKEEQEERKDRKEGRTERRRKSD
jgi:hypothetical protein